MSISPTSDPDPDPDLDGAPLDRDPTSVVVFIIGEDEVCHVLESF
jgi:hypothetical protein